MAASPTSEYGDPQQAVYTRNQLLAVYTSPLVPSRLEGMKELADWYGEFTDPPSPPPQRHGLPSRPSHTGSDRGERGTPSRRPLQNDPSNPFTNFGRFGVDGGLGSALEEGLGSSGRRRRGERSAGSGGVDDNKDLAPHLGGSRGGSGLGGLRGERSGGGGGFGRNDREDGGGSSPTRERSSFLSDRFAELRSGGDRDRRNGRNGGERDRDRERDRDGGLSGRSSGLGGGEFERRKLGGEGAPGGSSSSLDPLGGASRKEMRRGIGPADEGGWRNVGLSREEREKRLIRNNSSGTSLDSPRADRDRDRNDRGDRRDRDRDFERNGNSRLGGGRPSWMDDDGPNGGSSPAWMDAPATGSMSFGSGGKVDEGEEKKERESDGRPPGLSGLGAGGKGGMDSIQAWKAQMKEMERKERERDLKAAGIAVESAKEDERAKEADAAQASVFSALTGSGSTATASANEGKSIFEDLGITRPPPGLPLPKQAGAGGEEARSGGGGEAGGRGSRFARFFDGKPPTTQAQSPSMAAAQAPSVFGALMAGSGTSGGATSVAGGAAGTPGPSKEDADSMARLLGMLQVSGARTSSPPTSMKSPPQPAPPPQQQAQPPQILSPPVASAQPPSALASPALSSAANSTSEGRSGSRFKFSKSAAASPAQPAQPPIPQMQSPALAGAIQPPPPPGFGFPLSGGPAPADPRSPPQQSRPGPPNGIDAPSSVATTSPPAPAPQQPQKQQQQQPQQPHPHQSNPPFSPPIPPPGMPPQFFNGPPPGARFPPGQLPPGMPPFALGSDGRPIPPPNGFPGGGPGSSPFPSPGGMLRNGPLSPPISNAGSGISHPSPQAPHPSQQPPQHNGPPAPQFPPRNGPLSPPLPGQPPHISNGPNGMPPFPPPPHSSPFPPGAPMPPPHLFPGSNGMPPFPPPPPMGFLPPHLAGRGPGGPPPPPPGMFGGGGGRANPGADLMALLNSGAAGTRIGPMGAPQGQQGPR